MVLLSNDGTLPLEQPGRVAVIGPNADRVEALFGCYSFVNHVIPQHPGTATGITVATVREAVAAEWPGADTRRRPRLRGRRRRRHRHPGCRGGRRALGRRRRRRRRPLGPLRPRNRRRRVRPRRPRAPRGAAPPRGVRARHRDAGGPRAAHRAALRRRLGPGPLCRSGAGLLPRRGGRPRRRRRALRPGQPLGEAAREPAEVVGCAALLLPPSRTGRRRRRDQPRHLTHPGVRSRAVVHLVPARRPGGARERRPASRWSPGCGSRTPAPVAGPTSSSSTAATSSARSPVRWRSCSASTASTSSPGSRPRSPSRCRPHAWPSPTGPGVGWSNPAS